MAVSLYICFPADLIPQPGSVNDLAGFSVYTQNLLIHCAAAIVFAQVSSWIRGTTSCLSAMMHILLPCFARHIWIIVNTCLCSVCVCVLMHVHRLSSWTHNWPRNFLNSTLILHSYTLGGEPGCLQEIRPVWPPDSGTCNMSNMLQTNEKLRGKKIPLIQIKFLSNHLDAATAG